MKKFKLYYLLLALFYLVLELCDWKDLRYFFKPLLLILLSLYFYQSTKNKRGIFSVQIQIGLFFSLLGDTVLLFAPVKELFFILGLVMFLSAHVCYVLAFRTSVKNDSYKTSIRQFLLSTIPFIVFALVVFLFLKNSLGTLLGPVFAYISVITWMGISAALRFGKVQTTSFILILSGAIFFMISDTVLAVNKFQNPIPFAGVLIMSSYILAQYLIVEGSLAQVLAEEEIK